jgi:hypothetical protein
MKVLTIAATVAALCLASSAEAGSRGKSTFSDESNGYANKRATDAAKYGTAVNPAATTPRPKKKKN